MVIRLRYAVGGGRQERKSRKIQRWGGLRDWCSGLIYRIKSGAGRIVALHLSLFGYPAAYRLVLGSLVGKG